MAAASSSSSSSVQPVAAAAAAATTGAAGSPKLKVLALHGYTQNGQVFREKTGSFRKSLKALVGDVHFLEAPYAVAEAEAEGAGEGRSWWRWTDADGVERPSKALHYSGVDETLSTLRQALNTHRPDALLGFSQGATAVALLLASLAQHQEQGQQHVPRLAILAGGFLPRDEAVAAMLASSAPRVPTLFIAGEGDQLVPPERTRALMECFGGTTELLMHPGGHHVPSLKGEMKEAAVAFIQRHR
jgi:predicted esterase